MRRKYFFFKNKIDKYFEIVKIKIKQGFVMRMVKIRCQQLFLSLDTIDERDHGQRNLTNLTFSRPHLLKDFDGALKIMAGPWSWVSYISQVI